MTYADRVSLIVAAVSGACWFGALVLSVAFGGPGLIALILVVMAASSSLTAFIFWRSGRRDGSRRP